MDRGEVHTTARLRSAQQRSLIVFQPQWELSHDYGVVVHLIP